LISSFFEDHWCNISNHGFLDNRNLWGLCFGANKSERFQGFKERISFADLCGIIWKDWTYFFKTGCLVIGLHSFKCLHKRTVTIHLRWFAQEGCLITGWCLVGAMFTLGCKMNLILKATYKIQLALQLSSLNWIQQGQKLYPQILLLGCKISSLGGGAWGGETNKIQRYLIPRHW